MHLFFYIRGITQQVDSFLTFIQGQFFKWRRTNLKTGLEEIIVVQGALRPSILGAYEYVFPEEALEEVLVMLGIVRQDHLNNQTGHKNKRLASLKLALVRKLFGAKKIPKEAIEKAKNIPGSLYLKDSERAFSNASIIPGISLHPIGILEDEKRDFPETGYHQEAL